MLFLNGEGGEGILVLPDCCLIANQILRCEQDRWNKGKENGRVERNP